MDPLGVLNHLSGVMTTDEWREFVQTDDYLWMQARVEGFKGNAMKELARRGTIRRAEAWECALDLAKAIVRAEIEHLPVAVEEAQQELLVVRLAERLMCEQDFTPPSFTSWADCETCGRVPVPEEVPAKTKNCPWCKL